MDSCPCKTLQLEVVPTMDSTVAGRMSGWRSEWLALVQASARSGCWDGLDRKHMRILFHSYTADVVGQLLVLL